MSDPIADLLTALRNASMARKPFVDIRHSKIKEEIVRVLKEYGFIAHYLVKEENKKTRMRIFLKFASLRRTAIRGIKRISKPSLRKYVTHQNIPHVFRGMGISILSTSKGVLEGTQARKDKLGGEVLCIAW